MKSPVIYLTMLVVMLAFLASSLTLANPNPDITAQAAILMDYDSGEILYQKNAAERRAPASTTKILTVLVALEHGNPNQIITASTKASKADGSSIWLAAGERHSLRDLLYGILLSSGNDASIAVAENLAGSESKFAAWMTVKARQLGAKNSNFVNSNGLPEKEHYTTAYDLALITRNALHNPLFTEIVKTKKKIIDWPGHKWDRVMYNHNKLLWRYEYADGVKTGYTRQAGHCLVSSATKDTRRLIAVVLHSKNIYLDSQTLFNYGFNHFQLYTVASPDKNIGQVNVIEGVKDQVPVSTSQPISLLIPKSAVTKLKINVDLPPAVEAPVEQAQPVGELQVQLGQRILEKYPLVTAAPVARKGLWQKFWEWVKGLLR